MTSNSSYRTRSMHNGRPSTARSAGLAHCPLPSTTSLLETFQQHKPAAPRNAQDRSSQQWHPTRPQNPTLRATISPTSTTTSPRDRNLHNIPRNTRREPDLLPQRNSQHPRRRPRQSTHHAEAHDEHPRRAEEPHEQSALDVSTAHANAGSRSNTRFALRVIGAYQAAVCEYPCAHQ